MLAFFVAYLLCALALSSVDGFSLKTTNNVARSLSTQLDYKVRLINKKKNSDVTFECPPNKVFARYLSCVNPTLPSFHPMLCYAMLCYPTLPLTPSPYLHFTLIKYILDEAEQQVPAAIPWSCRAGSCSSCVGSIQSGTVDQVLDIVTNTLCPSDSSTLPH